MNDIPTPPTRITSMYADDTSIAVNGVNAEDLERNITQHIAELQSWFSTNDLQLNATKTQIVNYSPRAPEELSVVVDAETVASTPCANFLGISIDGSLNWKEQVRVLVSRLSSFSFVLRTLNSQISVEMALTAYYAYVHSRIAYGILFWGGSSDSERVFLMQKRYI